MIRPPDPPQQTANTNHQVQDMNIQKRPPRTSEDFLRFCDVVLSYANYPKAFYDEEDDAAQRKIESPLNSIGESARSNRSSTSTSDASVGEVESTEYDDSITCWCGKPFAGRPMIECESCLIWVHLSCARVRKSNIPKHFKCSRCKPPKVRRKRQSSGNSESEPMITSTPNSVPASAGNDRSHMLHGHQLNHSQNSITNHSGTGGFHQLNANPHQLMNLPSTNSHGGKMDGSLGVSKYGGAGDNHSRQGHEYNNHSYINGHSSTPGSFQSNHREVSNHLASNYASYSPGKQSNASKTKKTPSKAPKGPARPKQRKSQLESVPISHMKHNSGSSSGSSGFSNATPLRLNLSAGPPNVTIGLPTPSPSPSSSTSSSSSHMSINRGPPTLIPEMSSS